MGSGSGRPIKSECESESEHAAFMAIDVDLEETGAASSPVPGSFLTETEERQRGPVLGIEDGDRP